MTDSVFFQDYYRQWTENQVRKHHDIHVGKFEKIGHSDRIYVPREFDQYIDREIDELSR